MRFLIIYISLCAPFYFLAQRITDFRLIPAGVSVGVSFTISKGTSCNGYTIYHSSDSVHFNIISDYAGICGSSETDEHKSFTHTTPLVNQVNYYRVSLFPIETSEILRLYVPDQNKSGISLYPNPLLKNDGSLNIRFFDSENAKVTCAIYGHDGGLLKQINLTSGTIPSEIKLDEFKNGYYLIQFNDGLKNYFSKFVILR